MDELKQRAGEKIEALHEAAKTVADTSKSRVHDVYSQTAEVIHRLRVLFHEVWHHELLHEARARAQSWAREAERRVRAGAPLLAPAALYRHLRDLLHDRVWRRSMLIFACGAAVGGCVGMACGLRLAAGAPGALGAPGPHARALLAHPDHSVSLVEDAPTAGRAPHESPLWDRTLLVIEIIPPVQSVDPGEIRQKGISPVRILKLPDWELYLHLTEDRSQIPLTDIVLCSCGAGAGEVVVRVQAFSVGAADRGALRGRGRALRALLGAQHRAVGRGFAGVVLDVGVGVEDLEMGDEVWGCVAEWCGGAASELLTVRSAVLGRRPAGLGAERAAALPWGGAAALDALARLKLTPDTAKGKRVAVCGAASAEGCAALQLLAAWGAAPCALGPRACAPALRALGAQEVMEAEAGDPEGAWRALQAGMTRSGPWDALLLCGASPHRLPGAPASLLKARAPARAVVSLEPRALLTDRLPAPLSSLFAACFHSYRLLRWCVGLGWHTDWLQAAERLRPALDQLAGRVAAGELQPVLDKVFLPQDFECALAHACSEDTVGATVIRFP